MYINCIYFYLTHTITTVAPDYIVNVPETVNGPANTELLLASILTFLFKGELPSKDPSDIREDRRTRRREQFNTSKEEVLNSDNKNDYAPQGGHLSIKGYKKLSDLLNKNITN